MHWHWIRYGLKATKALSSIQAKFLLDDEVALLVTTMATHRQEITLMRYWADTSDMPLTTWVSFWLVFEYCALPIFNALYLILRSSCSTLLFPSAPMLRTCCRLICLNTHLKSCRISTATSNLFYISEAFLSFERHLSLQKKKIFRSLILTLLLWYLNSSIAICAHAKNNSGLRSR